MKPRIAIALLVVALVLSNAFWLYQLYDAAVTLDYRNVALQEHREALVQALAILPVVASPEASRDDVIATATKAAQVSVPFEKDGFLWVGSLGLKFGLNGRLEAVAPAWSPFP